MQPRLHRLIARWHQRWLWHHERLVDESGQATTEYALILLVAAVIALLAIGWATAGGGAGKIGSLRRVDDDVREVQQGFECGVLLDDFNDVKEGDEIEVFLQVENGTVSDVRIGGQGCSISQSSASMMSAAVKGKSIDEVRALVHRFRHMMSVEEEGEPDASVALGDLEALQGVVKFPVRIKCAVLAWNTLTDALDSATA